LDPQYTYTNTKKKGGEEQKKEQKQEGGERRKEGKRKRKGERDRKEVMLFPLDPFIRWVMSTPGARMENLSVRNSDVGY
jgi:hypothetical protein